VRMGSTTPAILRLADGRQHRGQLDALSLTGGLLNLPSVVDPGSRLKVLFVTRTGPVLASVEMLPPISTTGQPFQFLAIEEAHQRRLREVVQSSTETVQDAWVAKYRAALARPKPESRGLFRSMLRPFALLALMGSVAYLLGPQLLK
jgi:hypothetical protein